MPDTRKNLVELICTSPCNGNGESLGSCPDRKYGMCGEVADLSYCVIQNLVNHLISNGVTVQKWIPVTERLPGFEIERVLVITKGDFLLGYPKMDTDRYVNHRWVRYGDNVTHWMPLPEPPREVE